MKYLNAGCGSHYSILSEWTNLDFNSTTENVIAHNLLHGIPFENESFDLVYHSHVLEHFSKEDGEKFIKECFRVLKWGGIIRIVVPDLEMIARSYLKCLKEVLNKPNDKINKLNYEWTLLEMYDQTVRNYSGGDMAKYLFQDNFENQNFVFERLGDEARSIRNNFLKSKEKSLTQKDDTNESFSIISYVKRRIKKYLMKTLDVDQAALDTGKFRMSGEIHQWMYDRYSLSNLLGKAGGNNIQIRSAFTSFLNNWSDYNFDGMNGIVRKPDSVFIEAIK